VAGRRNKKVALVEGRIMHRHTCNAWAWSLGGEHMVAVFSLPNDFYRYR
jgi:hypothetical protein